MKLTGPRGRDRNGQQIVRSQFVRKDDRWQWAAIDANGRVVQVVEMSWNWPRGSYMPSTSEEALWVLRAIAAGTFHDVRCHRWL